MGHNLSETHDMPKKSRAAREQPSPGPSTNAPVTGVGSANACWNPLDEWRRGAVHRFPWLGVLARRVLAISSISAAPVRLFSTAGNVMTKKRSRLTCNNMEELVYLHDVLPQVREWEAIKKMHSA